MRFTHPDGQRVHVSYCTNVHPAEDLDGVMAQLDRYAVPVRQALDADVLGLGLWLAAPVAATLADDPSQVGELRSALSARGLEVVTLNGFPYSGFQRVVVKRGVYLPDWTSDERLDHTVRLARVLAGLLPDDAARGSVSTLPLAWRTPWDDDRGGRAGERLRRLGESLDEVRENTGRTIRVGFEPEPGCVVETTQDAVDRLGTVRHPSLGVCVDACHQAVAFEDPVAAGRQLAEARLPVVKLQASAALHVDRPADVAAREALATFAEDRFLHQVRRRPSDGGPATGWDDLDEALTAGDDGTSPWRVHFHVPLGREPDQPLASTTPQLRATLATLLGGEQALTDHVDAETYTWGVLPRHERPADDAALAYSITGELAWLRAELLDLGLKEE